MKLDELERLADAVISAPLAHRIDAFCRACDPDTIKELIGLVRQCKEALKDCFDYMAKPPAQRLVQPYSQTADALAAIEKWEDGK